MKSRKPKIYVSAEQCPQAGRERMIMPQPIEVIGNNARNPEPELLQRMRDTGAVFMMGQNPDLCVMPERPKLLDFFHFRFSDIAYMHLLQSAKLALDGGQEEKVVVACLLHDIANGALLRSDHGYWGAQMIAPYVSEEIAWAVQQHQALRYFADESVGFKYPDAYNQFFGADYKPPEYLCKAHEEARNHRWYMTSRLITIYDIYSFQEGWDLDPDQFTDIIGRHFKEPEEGLGFDNSPAAHMWRSMIWPHNFL
ncbi:MAG: HD domain-containing protein [Proteobacteria bacterium]|nr:HD domain-containing protein [Pseudomonadota bacterium]